MPRQLTAAAAATAAAVAATAARQFRIFNSPPFFAAELGQKLKPTRPAGPRQLLL